MTRSPVHIPSIVLGTLFAVLGAAGITGLLDDGFDAAWIWPVALVLAGVAGLAAVLSGARAPRPR